ncbi:MAG: GFA family protein [Parvibaculum sp.]
MPANPLNLPPPYEGGCACGAVRYRIEAETLGSRTCHCRICQKAMGAPFLAQATFPKTSVTMTGETARWRSSQRLWRHFCPACGSRVFLEPLDGPRMGIPLATLDNPAAIHPEMHIWVSSRVAWLKLDDGLPQYAESAPEPYRDA